MTKKHFIALVNLARRVRPVLTYDPHIDQAVQSEYGYVVEQLADFCEQQNPRFNRERWLGYIKGKNVPNGGKVK